MIRFFSTLGLASSLLLVSLTADAKPVTTTVKTCSTIYINGEAVLSCHTVTTTTSK